LTDDSYSTSPHFLSILPSCAARPAPTTNPKTKDLRPSRTLLQLYRHRPDSKAVRSATFGITSDFVQPRRKTAVAPLSTDIRHFQQSCKTGVINLLHPSFAVRHHLTSSYSCGPFGPRASIKAIYPRRAPQSCSSVLATANDIPYWNYRPLDRRTGPFLQYSKFFPN
jgi:hypothetical protein